MSSLSKSIKQTLLIIAKETILQINNNNLLICVELQNKKRKLTTEQCMASFYCYVWTISLQPSLNCSIVGSS